MRVALTGANGFTGREVGRQLDALGIRWVSIEADLGDSSAISAAVAETPFDCLIHLAACAFAGAQQWRPFYEINLIGTLSLLEAVARHRPGIRCILASSAQVYGPQASGRVDEHHPTRPVTSYGVSKLAMELGSAPWRNDLDIIATRPFNYTGVGQSEKYLIPKIIRHFRDRAAVIELGNTHVARDFGDVRSVATAYCGLVTSNEIAPVINLCTGEAHTITQILDLLRDMTGHSIEVRVNPAFVRSDDIPLLVGDNHLLRSLLPEWRPKALSETIEWMLASG
ncbi:GDP-mannose 4,6-dehydratase [Sphingomonas sp. DT-207]|uniref:GDP-mannose 4,6-dehydratase n=1 Tax=Sphingomonas sp. DT-207 TaxID=3396167 RepID=UPI003F194A5F